LWGSSSSGGATSLLRLWNTPCPTDLIQSPRTTAAETGPPCLYRASQSEFPRFTSCHHHCGMVAACRARHHRQWARDRRSRLPTRLECQKATCWIGAKESTMSKGQDLLSHMTARATSRAPALPAAPPRCLHWRPPEQSEPAERVQESRGTGRGGAQKPNAERKGVGQ
jgi:hypothetical protein